MDVGLVASADLAKLRSRWPRYGRLACKPLSAAEFDEGVFRVIPDEEGIETTTEAQRQQALAAVANGASFAAAGRAIGVTGAAVSRWWHARSEDAA
jgi:hypothetical protein